MTVLAGKRSLLISLPFPKVLEWYFHYKKSYIGEIEIGHVAHLGHGLKVPSITLNKF